MNAFQKAMNDEHMNTILFETTTEESIMKKRVAILPFIITIFII